MRTVAAFFATIAIAVPAAWHVLDADIKSDGPATRPKQETLQIDDTTSVTVELDRGVLMAGGKLVAKLVGTSEKPQKIALDVRALEDMGYGAERVENPPLEVGRRKITIEAAPGGGKPTEVAFTLGEPGKWGVARGFDIVVRKAGKKKADEDADAARVGAVTWSGNSYPIAIEPPAEIPRESPFTVAVRVTNTTKRPLKWLNIELGTTRLFVDGLDSALSVPSYEQDDVPYKVDSVDEEVDDAPLAPGASRVVHFLVTPHPTAEGGVAAYTLTAHASSQRGGALDVETFKATAETAPTPVAANSRVGER